MIFDVIVNMSWLFEAHRAYKAQLFQTKLPLSQTKSIVYQATVESEDSTETYVGLTANEFKYRYNNHTS